MTRRNSLFRSAAAVLVVLLLSACGVGHTAASAGVGAIVDDAIDQIENGEGGRTNLRLFLHAADPKDGSRDVDVAAVLTLEFSEPPSRESVESLVRLKRGSGEPVNVRFTVVDDLVTVRPLDPLAPGRMHVLVIGRIEPEPGYGRKMKAGIQLRFRTAEAKPVGLLRNTDAYVRR